MDVSALLIAVIVRDRVASDLAVTSRCRRARRLGSPRARALPRSRAGIDHEHSFLESARPMITRIVVAFTTIHRSAHNERWCGLPDLAAHSHQRVERDERQDAVRHHDEHARVSEVRFERLE